MVVPFGKPFRTTLEFWGGRASEQPTRKDTAKQATRVNLKGESAKYQ
jgi:hypothetical protein